MEKPIKKSGDGSRTGWREILTFVLCLLSNVGFLIGVGWAICKSVPATEAYIFSMILALFSLNIAVTFFIPMLITKNQVISTVRSIVDQSVEQKFIKEKTEQYATQKNIADILRNVSGLLFWQERYIWSLSCALNALNEYMKITPDTMRDSNIRNMWISIEAMINIIVNKNNTALLEKEFPISNDEIKLVEDKKWLKEAQSKKEQLAKDKKDMLIRFYIEIFELVYQKEELIYIMGDNFKKQVNSCLNILVQWIIDITAKECKIEYEEIKSTIRKESDPFKNAETRKTAEKTLKDLIKN
jgi:hypothetical protein